MLEEFYADASRVAVAFQSYVGLTMAKRNEVTYTMPIVLAERSIESGKHCFIPLQKELGLIHSTDEIVLQELMEYFIQKTRKPDLILYLRCDPNVALERIQRRGRQEEKNVSGDYIQRLHRYHEDWLMDGDMVKSPTTLVFDNNANLSEDDDEAYQKLGCYLRQIITDQ